MELIPSILTSDRRERTVYLPVGLRPDTLSHWFYHCLVCAPPSLLATPFDFDSISSFFFALEVFAVNTVSVGIMEQESDSQ